jgi:hypothetical protein
MHFLALLLAITTARPAAAAPPENLLRGPARCVLRYLEAVRLAGPRAPGVRPDGPVPAREEEYAAAKQLTAPRALVEIGRRGTLGEDHPLAPWREATRGAVLESFQLLAVRRAPVGAAVVTVRERFWHPSAWSEPLARRVSEYLVGRVHGEWRVVDRQPGGAFDDERIATGYAGWFDPPAGAVLSDGAAPPAGMQPGAGRANFRPTSARATPTH